MLGLFRADRRYRQCLSTRWVYLLGKLFSGQPSRGETVPRTLQALIVEDSVLTRKMIMKDIAATGLADFQFVEADDGMDGLDKFRPGEMDILFVDMQMPRLDGLSFLRELRRLHHQHPPAVMITAESSQDLVDRAISQARVEAFLLKPVNRQRLTAGLKRLIGSIQDRNGPSAVPNGECVPQALAMLLEQTCSLELTPGVENEEIRRGAVVFSGIHILGDQQWSVLMGMSRKSAAELSSRFAGMPIDPDSPDLSDAISELTNQLAGFIQRLLGQRGLAVNISLPIVSAGSDVRTLSRSSATCDRQFFDTPIGPIWTVLTVGMSPGLVL